MIIQILAFIIVLGFLVFVHEFGHFIVAKWIGVRVDVFSIGFGPKIVGFQRGDTDYRIAAIPLGGYVKMAGHDPGEELTGAKFEFGSRKVWERVAIIFAGPLMNLIWAVLFIAFLYYAGIEKPVYLSHQATVGWVEGDSPAAKAGLHVGDILKEIAGKPVGNWEDVYNTGEFLSSDHLPVQIERAGKSIHLLIESNDSLRTAFPLLGLSPPIPAQVGRLVPGFPAEKAGLKEGDVILKINADSIHSFYQMTRIVRSSADSVLHLVVRRNNANIKFDLVARIDETTGNLLIGIGPFQQTETIKYGVATSLRKSVETNLFLSTLLGDFIARVFQGRASGDEIGGPIKIAEMAGEAARNGVLDLIRLMGFLSLQLGLLNLLPIPVLDGGYLFLLTIEAVMRKPLSQGSREIIQMFGLMILITIMVYVFYNDILSYFAAP